MLFSAGMGIGLVFWGVSEPVSHYLVPPEGIEGGTPGAARVALRYSFFHWGLHAWGIYTVIALALAYTQFRKKDSGLISSTFRPLIGHHADGPLGKAIDILAVIATVFGVATSLGLGTLQINAGLQFLAGIPLAVRVQLTIIAVVTLLYLSSAITGLERGIRYLSNLNLGLAGGLLLFVLIAGSTSFIFDSFTTTVGDYIGNLIFMSFRLTPFTEGDWVSTWTLFYWAWWIAWAPFVGTFIARVSRGRTVKEFVIGVLFVPTLLGTLWFSVFGGSALFFEMFEQAGIAEAVQADTTSGLFLTLDQLPISLILTILATALIMTFFITSADSATFVLGMLTSAGSLNPPTSRKLIWGGLQSSIAAVLLLSGGLVGLQTASIIAALPFSIIMIFMMISLNKALRAEVKDRSRQERKRIKELEEWIEREENTGTIE